MARSHGARAPADAPREPDTPAYRYARMHTTVEDCAEAYASPAGEKTRALLSEQLAKYGPGA